MDISDMYRACDGLYFWYFWREKIFYLLYMLLPTTTIL